MKKREIVSINVDRDFFEKSFEPARRKLGKKLGLMNLSQAKFTKILGKNKLNLDIKLKGVIGNDFFGSKKRRKKR